jgi:hypothetical protein
MTFAWEFAFEGYTRGRLRVVKYPVNWGPASNRDAQVAGYQSQDSHLAELGLYSRQEPGSFADLSGLLEGKGQADQDRLAPGAAEEGDADGKAE